MEMEIEEGKIKTKIRYLKRNQRGCTDSNHAVSIKCMVKEGTERMF